VMLGHTRLAVVRQVCCTGVEADLSKHATFVLSLSKDGRTLHRRGSTSSPLGWQSLANHTSLVLSFSKDGRTRRFAQAALILPFWRAASGKTSQAFPVSAYERFFLCAAPALDLSLERDGIRNAVEPF
jgi:hypothetical protein